MDKPYREHERLGAAKMNETRAVFIAARRMSGDRFVVVQQTAAGISIGLDIDVLIHEIGPQ